jgi:hypothetical protein
VRLARQLRGRRDYGSPYEWGFVVSETNGVWGRAINVPGLGKLVSGRYADVTSVTCASPGNCAATGYYEDTRHFGVAGFVVSEKNGVWGRSTWRTPHLRRPGPGAASADGRQGNWLGLRARQRRIPGSWRRRQGWPASRPAWLATGGSAADGT